MRYGGNTPCIEVRCGERVLIFDAGTGLRSLGIELLKDKKIRDVDIFITHCHLDHVSGLPFFAPFFREDYRVRVWAGNLMPSNSIEHVMRRLMSSPWFPVPIEIFKAKIEFRDFKSGDVLQPHDDITLRTALLDHPDSTNGYRLEHGGRAFALLCDTEGFPGKRDAEMVSLARQADLAIYDATFTEGEIDIQSRLGSFDVEARVRMANEAGVKHLCLFHHDPSHDDDFMDKLAAEAMMCAPEQSRREKARSSICNPIECRSRDCSGSLLIQGEQRAIVANILSVEDRHRTIVQNQRNVARNERLRPRGLPRVYRLAR